MNGAEEALLQLASYLAVCLGLALGLHHLRMHGVKGPFLMLTAFLWFLAYLFGHLNLKIMIDPDGSLPIKIRYSSAIYTLIFANLLLVYVSEGVREARDLIWVSLGAQLLLILTQLFVFHLALPGLRLSEETQKAAALIFRPSIWRLSVGVLCAVLDLFFVVLAFQFFLNRLSHKSILLPLLLSLVLTMALDSVIFNALTRPASFASATLSHLSYKPVIAALISAPLALYLYRFQRKGHLELKRGSFDIFKKLSQMEEDLARANEQLRRHNEELESLVAERTAALEEKQRQINLELEMAADLQKAMIPKDARLNQIRIASAFVPCSVVSGDLFTYGQLDEDHFFCFLGDISGHGVASALVGAMCSMSLSRLNLRSYKPAEVLQQISSDILESSQDHYLTGVYADFNTKSRIFTYASGAHVSPLLVTPDGRHAFLEPTGSLIGTDLGMSFEQKRIRYVAGSKLLLFTDCLLEHKNPTHEEYGQDRLKAIVLMHRNAPPAELKELILKDLNEFGEGNPYLDDLSLLILELP